MDFKSKFYWRIALGSVIIAATIFLSFRYLFKGPPFIKVLALGLMIAVSYSVIDYLIKYQKKKENE